MKKNLINVEEIIEHDIEGFWLNMFFANMLETIMYYALMCNTLGLS